MAGTGTKNAAVASASMANRKRIHDFFAATLSFGILDMEHSSSLAQRRMRARQREGQSMPDRQQARAKMARESGESTANKGLFSARPSFPHSDLCDLLRIG